MSRPSPSCHPCQSSLAAIAIVVRIVQIEIGTSRLQVHYLSELTRDIGFAVESGQGHSIRFPTTNGPYDMRLGCAQLAAFIDRLEKRGVTIGEHWKPDSPWKSALLSMPCSCGLTNGANGSCRRVLP